jgi:hypothetical protein
MAFCTVRLEVRVFAARLSVAIQNLLSFWSDTVSAIARWMLNVAPVYGECLYTKPTASALMLVPFFYSRFARYQMFRDIIVFEQL